MKTGFLMAGRKIIQRCPLLGRERELLAELAKNDPAAFWQKTLFAAFWVSIAFFPIGYGFREALPPLCLIFLCLYYRHGWRESVLRHLKPAWLFLCPLIMTILGVVFSIHPWEALLHAGTGVNKGFIIPFIAMECVKSGEQLKKLVWAFVFACFWQGLDGIYQSITGVDFIMGYAKNAGRLTGSLGDYTLGNYLALAFIPAMGVWFILRQNCPRLLSLFLYFALLWPAFFTIMGAGARSGMLALAAAVFLYFLLARGPKNWAAWTAPLLIALAFWLFQPGRLDPAYIAGDNRWDLWRLAWAVIREHPWLGAGPGQYNTAFRELGLKPQYEEITISHPHDLYLDMLYAHGIIGFVLGMIFLCGFLLWGLANILPRMRRGDKKLYWRLTAFFWLAYAGWLVNGIFGHDFYRLWWLAEAMTFLGIMAGAIGHGQRREMEANAEGNLPAATAGQSLRGSLLSG